MQVVEVIPVVKGIAKQSLTYFTRETFAPGSFVRIPVRSGSSLGIVVGSTPASSAKAELKSQDFALRKLSKVERAGSISPSFLRAAELSSHYYAATLGSVLGQLLPKLFLESPELLGTGESAAREFREIKVIQLPDSERLQEYKSVIRESFARKESVMLCVPTREDGLTAEDELSQGIEDYVFRATGRRQKELKALVKKARATEHPILFITTPSLLAFDRPDLETIIFERENSRLYRTRSRPFIHWRIFLGFLARSSGKTLIMGDSVLSLESQEREREGLYGDAAPPTWRVKYSATAKLIDMRKRKFEVISPEMREMMSGALKGEQNIFLFVARKGLAPHTVCGDCGSLLTCENCGAPLVLHTGPTYVCHRCGASRSASTRCDTCNSWKLNPLGIATDRVALEVHRLFPEAPLFALDKETTPTAPLAKAAYRAFQSTPGAVLIGTELALMYLKEVPYTGVVSLDSLFSIPDFAMNEHLFSLVSRMRQMTTRLFLAQSRNVGEQVLFDAADGNILDFYRREIKERQELNYPPFTLFVKVSVEGTKEWLESRAVYLQKLFKDDAPHFILERRGEKHSLSMLLRRPRQSWPEGAIVEKLLLLPPEFLIKVDPDSIL